MSFLSGCGTLKFSRHTLRERFRTYKVLERSRSAMAAIPSSATPIALLGVIGLSVFGCYVYYPPPSDIFEELRIVNTEVVTAATSQHWDSALYWIPIYDDWTRKLQVSMFLRGEQLTPYHRAKADVLREKLELLEHEVEDEEVEQSRQLGMDVARAYRRMRTAYMASD